MGSYSLLFKPSVQKDLRPIPRAEAVRMLDRISGLVTNPHPPGTSKLSGVERLYRLRAESYRTVYEVDTQARQITVHYIRHRREAYRRF
jgi:mRNA interferase RelE/StbE